MIPSAKAMARAREKLRELTGPQRCFVPIPQLIAEINRWIDEAGVGTSATAIPGRVFRKLNWYVVLTLDASSATSESTPLPAPEGESFYAHLQRLGLRLL